MISRRRHVYRLCVHVWRNRCALALEAINLRGDRRLVISGHYPSRRPGPAAEMRQRDQG